MLPVTAILSANEKVSVTLTVIFTFSQFKLNSCSSHKLQDATLLPPLYCSEGPPGPVKDPKIAPSAKFPAGSKALLLQYAFFLVIVDSVLAMPH